MKWLKRFAVTVLLSSALGAGVYFENIYLIGLALSLPYLFTILLFERFATTRDRLFGEIVFQSHNHKFLNTPVIPLSCDEGVHIFQQKGEARVAVLGNYHFSISELQSNLLQGDGVESYKLEKRYDAFLRESRFFILLTQVMGIALAGHMVYAQQEYLYLAIPLLMLLYHFFFYAHIFEGASALKFSQKINKDREFLTYLMAVYVEAVLGVKEAEVTNVGVFPMGDIMVRFVKDEAEHFYYVPYDDRLVIEDFLVEALQEQAREEEEESKAKVADDTQKRDL